MKATLDRDIILAVGTGDDEVGALPKGVGLERLRWTGAEVVDLMDLQAMWVEPVGGAYVLHAIPVQNSQHVEMRYADRKLLIAGNGGIRLKSEKEITEEKVKKKIQTLLSRISAASDNAFLLDVIKLLYAFIIAQRQPNEQLGAWFDTQIADMGATFDWTAERARMEKLIDLLKTKMGEYYAQQ